MIKVLHCADIHLDAPFVGGGGIKSEMRKQELFATFSKMTEYVKVNGIDLVIISGDLFESENVTRGTAELLYREFAANKDCIFVIAPGNHDPYTPDGVYGMVRFPSNVYIFDRPEISSFDFPKLGVRVYGYAFVKKEMEENPFRSFSVENNDRINILCAHGDLNSPDSKSCPISIDDIKNSGFDYIGLGHIHAGSDVQRARNTYFAYAGCLEGRDFGECGKKGAVYCEFDKKEGVLEAKFKKLRFSKRRFEIEKINISGATSIADVLPAVKSVIEEKEYKRDTLLRVVLEGDVSPELVISQGAFASVSEELFYFEVVNKTRPLFDIEKLENDPTVRGAFYNELKAMLESGDEKTAELAYAALKYGLSALGGSNVIDF